MNARPIVIALAAPGSGPQPLMAAYMKIDGVDGWAQAAPDRPIAAPTPTAAGGDFLLTLDGINSESRDSRKPKESDVVGSRPALAPNAGRGTPVVLQPVFAAPSRGPAAGGAIGANAADGAMDAASSRKAHPDFVWLPTGRLGAAPGAKR